MNIPGERTRSDGTCEYWTLCSRCARARWIPQHQSRCTSCQQKVEGLFDFALTALVVVVVLLIGVSLGSAIALLGEADRFAIALSLISFVMLVNALALAHFVAKYLHSE